MEQPCYKCGQPVEEGIAFCPHCAAPQIRVILPDPTPALALAADSAEAGATTLPASHTVPVLAVPMHWSDALRPCALAALIATVLMLLGLNPFVAMVSVGFLAVVFYRQRRPEVRVTATQGAGLGVLGGLLWFALSSILGALVVLFMHQGGEIRTQLIQKIQQAAAQTQDVQVKAMFDRLQSPDGLEFLIVLGLVLAFLSCIVLGGFGGALGGVVLGRRNRS